MARREQGKAKKVWLHAQDGEDLRILSAMLQDAALRVGDIVWLPRRRRFAFGGSRFRWERAAGDRRPQRIGFGAHLDGVLSVAHRGIPQDRPDEVLVLLALTHAEAGDGGAEIGLIFAGGGAINLRVECIDMTLTDLGMPYATRLKPAHVEPGHAEPAGGEGASNGGGRAKG